MKVVIDIPKDRYADIQRTSVQLERRTMKKIIVNPDGTAVIIEYIGNYKGGVIILFFGNARHLRSTKGGEWDG